MLPFDGSGFDAAGARFRTVMVPLTVEATTRPSMLDTVTGPLTVAHADARAPAARVTLVVHLDLDADHDAASIPSVWSTTFSRRDVFANLDPRQRAPRADSRR